MRRWGGYERLCVIAPRRVTPDAAMIQGLWKWVSNKGDRCYNRSCQPECWHPKHTPHTRGFLAPCVQGWSPVPAGNLLRASALHLAVEPSSCREMQGKPISVGEQFACAYPQRLGDAIEGHNADAAIPALGSANLTP